LLPTFKFPGRRLLDRYDVPGFARFWGKRRGWIMLSQLGIFTSMVAMALTASDESLPLTALFAVLLAFWTTTLEVAADAWRIELAPTREEQGPIVAANLWGYRTAMVAAGSGALLIADRGLDGILSRHRRRLPSFRCRSSSRCGPIPAMTAAAGPPGDGACRKRRDPVRDRAVIGGRGRLGAAIGVAAQIGISAKTNVTPYVLVVSHGAVPDHGGGSAQDPQPSADSRVRSR
jgi:PAT family beta-lactamase induction signal transducer AmpG